MSIPENEIWQEFFNKYESLPELWKIKSDDFKNKFKKNKAWNELLKVYQAIDPGATVEKMETKINSIRSSYRREWRKMKDSQKSGAGEDEVYVSNIWYIEALSFLKDQEEQLPGISSIAIENSSTPFNKHKKHKADTNAEKVELLKRAVASIENEGKDKASVFAAAWAVSYRKLSVMQQLYAKKAIDEILILGQLHQLSLHSVSTSSQSSTRTSTPTSVTLPAHSPGFVNYPNVSNTQAFDFQQHGSSSSLTRTSTPITVTPPADSPNFMILPNFVQNTQAINSQQHKSNSCPTEEYHNFRDLFDDASYNDY